MSKKHQSNLLYQVVNALGEETSLYGPQGASYIEMGLNMVSVVNPRALTFAFPSGAKSAGPAIHREMFREVSLVSNALAKPIQVPIRASFIPQFTKLKYDSTAASTGRQTTSNQFLWCQNIQ